MKYQWIIYCMAILVVFQSCNETLKLEPRDFLSPSQYFENESQLNDALNGVYSTLAASGSPYRTLVARMGLDADEGYADYSADVNSVADYRVVPTDPRLQEYWSVFYSGIYKANMLLENIDRPQMDSIARARIKGQALFLRSYYYLMLVNRFGDVPLVLKTASGVSQEDLFVPQAPAKQVYEQILTDMETASELVEDAVHPGRVSKSAVWGIMARVCLYMAGQPINDVSKYGVAKKWALKVITSGKHSLEKDYKQIFINYAQDKYDIRESIWEVEFWGNGTGLFQNAAGMVGRNNGIGNTGDPNIGQAIGVLRSTAFLYRLYDNDDVRRDWNIAPFYYRNIPAETVYWAPVELYNRYCGKWRREYETVLPRTAGVTPQNYPLLRYSDVLLMYAEADCMENFSTPSPEAYNAFNQVRRRGHGKEPNDTSIDFTDTDPTSFMLELRDERARELAFESLRKSDLIRWGIFYDNMKAVYTDLQPMTTSRATIAKRTYENASRRDVLWPIPNYELGVNKKLKQNSGW